ncbi:hypothetical protein tb265_20060 [Gemmatimonadetes bacterium T265]|nr:hypothetical protein tb265_20060 [Gemmatimonadetes bacterium T265]
MPRPRKADAAKSTPGTITARGDAYRLRLAVGGRRHSFTFPPGTAIEAVRQFATAKHRELLEATGSRAGARRARTARVLVRIADLCALYERDVLPTRAPGTQTAYRGSLAAIRAFFVLQRRNPRVDAVTRADVVAFLAWRRTAPRRKGRTDPVTLRTVAKDRAVLHRLFAVATERELRETNPVTLAKAAKGDPHAPVILDAAQYEALLGAAVGRPMLAAYLLVLGETGLRAQSEALWLRWEHVDFARGFLTVASGKAHRTKSGEGRDVPMTARLVAALRAHAAAYRLATYPGRDGAAHHTPWLFHHLTTRRHHRAGERIATLDAAVAGAARRAKLPAEFRRHDLRHRRVTTWLQAGKSPALIQQAMGHADIRTTMAYAHLVSDDLRSLVDEPGPAPSGVPRTA